jgi:hypothetical protein
MIAATSAGWAASKARTLSTSLNRAVSVSRAVAAVTPGLSGVPKVAAPEPAFTRKLSPCP